MQSALKRNEVGAQDAPAVLGVERSATGRRWTARLHDERGAAAIQQKLGLSDLLARALAARGVSAQEAEAFLAPRLRDSLPDPYALKDMEAAAERLSAAIDAGEKIAIFGDYDVDGTTACAILKKYLDAAGAQSEIYIPHRIRDGYGPSEEAFGKLIEGGARIIVTVDCGSVAYAPIALAAASGVDVIVIDHHLVGADKPQALALVNPQRIDDESGLENLSASALAFLLAAAVGRLRKKGEGDERGFDLLGVLDLAALGLICDVSRLTGFARVLAAQGLKVLGARRNIGLAALCDAAGLRGRPDAYHAGFLLGPRLNAAGRIGDARIGLELLTTSDPARAAELARRLNALNEARREIEREIQAQADDQAAEGAARGDPVLIACGDGWHPGVLGIVAGRLKERFRRPAIAIGFDGEDAGAIGKGSGRSIAGVDLGGAISAARDAGVLAGGGGHAMAAGLSAARDNIEPLRRFLAERLGEAVARAREKAELVVDGIVGGGAVNPEFVEEIARLGPFGPGNAEPVFVASAQRIEHVRPVGENHLAVAARDMSGARIRAIAFRSVGEPIGEMLTARDGALLHLAGKITRDDYRGGAQLQIVDVARSACDAGV